MTAEFIVPKSDSGVPPYISEKKLTEAKRIFIEKCPTCPFRLIYCYEMDSANGVGTLANPITESIKSDIQKSAPCISN